MDLKDRFHFTAFGPFLFFLIKTGIYRRPFVGKREDRFFYVWCIFVFVLCIQSNFYIAFSRSPVLKNFSEFLNSANVRDFVNAIFRFSSLVADITIHMTIVCTIGPTINHFLETLELVDYDLRRPRLSRVKFVSFISFIYAVFMVSV